jgi:hypothetical protein
VDPRPYFEAISQTEQQLCLAAMWRSLQLLHPKWRYQQRHPAALEPAGPGASDGWVQLRLFDSARDYRRIDPKRHANPANPTLMEARRIAAGRAELRGWGPELRPLVDRGLVIVLSDHRPGEQIRYSEILPLARHRKVVVERLAEVLTELGIFIDDRPDPFEAWLGRRLDGLAPGIAADVEA